MLTLAASIPLSQPPVWAVLERRLIDAMNESVRPFVRKYTREDGRLIWGDGPLHRDGADDFYESCTNWALLYALGGGDHLLSLHHHLWDGITRQLTDLGMLRNEYEFGYDQFHQSESYIAFYYLCLADPANPKLIDRARRFAGLYLNEDPEAPNYDPLHKIIRAPHNGSGGPRWGISDSTEPSYGYSPGMAPYGLPYEDVPGVRAYEDLKDPHLARRTGEAMQRRMGRGDVAANLGVTSLVANAGLLTGDAKYRRWVLEYVDAWIDRARLNGGLLPDNVGLSGQVGEYLDGRWYGGLYGWSWPHGFYNVGASATVAAINACLLTRDMGYLDLARWQMDKILALGETRAVADLPMSLRQHWVGIFGAMEDARTFVVPYRYSDSGWFDYQPMSPIYPAAVWNVSLSDADWKRIEDIRAASGYDWRRVSAFHSKEDSGHEQPWLRFLAGDNPDYPERMLAASHQTVCRRLELIRRDAADLRTVNIHHWQELNPVTTEALVQLTTGAPQALYYGGFLMAQLRYFDAQRRRPGLPEDVAALVEKVESARVAARLVNLSPTETREVLIQAGGLAEHRIASVGYSALASEYPGSQKSYLAPPLQTEMRAAPAGARWLSVTLPPATEIALELAIERFVYPPSYAPPDWSAPAPPDA